MSQTLSHPEPPRAQLPSITIGNSDFPNVCDDGTLFVDKTAKLASLFKLKKVFFARPRRFGKSTLVSMLKELFAHGTERFQGMAIHDTWPEQRCYPVIALSFHGMHQAQDLERQLCEQISNALVEAGFPEVYALTSGISTLSTFLWKIRSYLSSHKTVWLIDEWDYPLSQNLNQRPSFEANREVLGTLFSWLRELPNLHFMLVTGIARYSATNLFTGQDIRNISLHPEFADLLGYTQAEVESNFAAHITKAAELLELTPAEFLAQLKRHYDGYYFDQNTSLSLYNPWSINNFFQQLVDTPSQPPLFLPYWVTSSNAPAALRSFVTTHQVDFAFIEQIKSSKLEIVQEAFNEPSSFTQLDLKSLLVQTGFLSIKRVTNPANISPTSRAYQCDFPNLEVEANFAHIFLQLVAEHNQMGEAEFNQTATQLRSAICAQDMPTAVTALNTFMRMIPYDVWKRASEVTYRTFICWSILFSQITGFTREETINNRGRSDLELEFDHKLLVIELKRLPKDQTESRSACLKLADQAQAQIIDRAYGHNASTWQKPKFTERLGLILVISPNSRQIVYWRLITPKVSSEPIPPMRGEGWSAPLSEASNKHPSIPAAQDTVKQTSPLIPAPSTPRAGRSDAPAPQSNTSAPQGFSLINKLSLQVLISSAQAQAQADPKSSSKVQLDPEALSAMLLVALPELKQMQTDLSPEAIEQQLRFTIDAVQAITAPHTVTIDRDFLVRQLANLLTQAQ